MDDKTLSMSFRTMQVLSDLKSAAASGFSDLAVRLGDAQKARLRRVIFEQECKLTDEDAEQMHGALMMVASMPDQDHGAFMTATILLLADRLQMGAGQDDLFWNWDAFEGRYREAISPVRAALMNGFACAHEMELLTLDAPPRGTDLRTYDEADLVRLLKIIARRMTDDIRDGICAMAHEETREVHRAALENCLRTSCVLSEFGGWFPAEVVELASLDATHPGHGGATAMMLLDAIITGDAAGKMAHRYEELAEDYFELQTDLRPTMIAGLRHLHEMEAPWEPYAGWAPEMRLNKAIVMPFAKS